MESLSTKDLQVFREKSRTFCGSFQIPLDKLQAEELPENLRQRNDKDIARLLNEFSAEDQRLEPENHVLALGVGVCPGPCTFRSRAHPKPD